MSDEPDPQQARRLSPAAERNKAPILEQLRGRLPVAGVVLEVASGSGQHVAHFAAAVPALSWQPSDPDPALRASVSANVAAAGVDNVAAPLDLDVTRRPWPVARADAVLCINMIHIAPWEATASLLEGAATVLPAGALLHLYGPFRRGGRHTAPSNADFDASLRARDPRWGVRDLDEVAALAATQGLAASEVVAMPANNLYVTFRRG